MANLRTTTDIINDVLFRCDEPTDGSSDFHAQVLSDLNRVYRELCVGGGELLPDMDADWWWLRKSTPGVLTLKPAITAGTVSLTLGSVIGSFSQAPVDCFGQQVSVKGWFFQNQADDGDVYMIGAHTLGSTSFSLDSFYTSP